jgi:hypothetical protein
MNHDQEDVLMEPSSAGNSSRPRSPSTEFNKMVPDRPRFPLLAQNRNVSARASTHKHSPIFPIPTAHPPLSTVRK